MKAKSPLRNNVSWGRSVALQLFQLRAKLDYPFSIGETNLIVVERTSSGKEIAVAKDMNKVLLQPGDVNGVASIDVVFSNACDTPIAVESIGVVTSSANELVVVRFKVSSLDDDDFVISLASFDNIASCTSNQRILVAC
ncbi:MAG: hypothetical protein F9B45_09635 [Phycisphaera sp. RhM]|nr:hypothetical protein [Phycisphaera sp. RhM]